MKFELKSYNQNITEEEIIEDFKRVALLLNKNSVTQREYLKNGNYSVKSIYSRFKSWFEITERAGLVPSVNSSRRDITIEELFENLENVWIQLGRQPSYSELLKPLSLFSTATYERRFGTWRKALEAFVEFANSESKSYEGIETIVKNNSTHSTSRTINLRLRFLVLQRDNFKCKICGKSPATDQSVILEVDHIVAWSKGGETVPDNLQSLCFYCNQGKSNLDFNIIT